jgi:hypothetical protein
MENLVIGFPFSTDLPERKRGCGYTLAYNSSSDCGVTRASVHVLLTDEAVSTAAVARSTS